MAIESTSDLSKLDSAPFEPDTDLTSVDGDPDKVEDSHPLWRAKAKPRGREVTATAVWAEARNRKLDKAERDIHRHRIWYCRRCAYKGTVTNRWTHLRSLHSLDLRKTSLLQKATTTSGALKSAFIAQQL